jgi:hypothetical protein
MESLDLDNILTLDDMNNLFEDNDNNNNSEDNNDNPTEEEQNKEETTEIDVDNLFEDQSESVGSGTEDKVKDNKEDTNQESNGTSPNNFYSSIAKAFKEEGIFPDLDEASYNKIKSPEDFRDLVEQQIRAGLDERQKRIDEALNVGIEPDEIKKYENTLSYLDSIDIDAINDESEKGENLRKQLIFQDFINRGYSKERAQREINKSFQAGSDIDDAKEALSSNKDYFKNLYNNLIKEAREAEEKDKQEIKAQSEKLKTSILEDKNFFGELDVDKPTRQRIYDNIAKPIYKDESGNYLSAIQKYEKENRTDFLKNLSLVFTLTDGFKNMDGLVKGKVKKEVKRGLRELEHTLNNTARTSDGSLNFVSGVDEESSFKNYRLDI